MRKALGLAIFICFATAIFAQEKAQEPEVTLEDIFNLVQEGKVITATKTERLLKTAPQAVTVITRTQIQESGASTLAEVLRFVPGVNVRLTPMGSVIGIRSFGPSPFTERVLLLIDGTPYNSPDKGGYPGHPAYEDFFPIEHIKRIEVIKGPGSALYGQNAFFGIINIITEDFADSGTRAAVIQGGSRDTARVAVSSGDRIGNLNYSFTGKYKQQNGPMEFDRNTDVKSGDFYFKTNYRGLSLAYLFHKDQSGPFVIDSQNNINTVETDQTLNFIDATYNRNFSNAWKWRAKVFFNRRDGNTCESCHNPRSFGHVGQPVLEADEVNQRVFMNTQLDWSPGNHRIIFGSDVQVDRTTKDLVRLPGADENIRTVAGYAQGEFTFADGKVITTAGARVDHNEITEASVSPSVSAVFLPSQKVVLRTSYGRAFRQPTWNDLFIDMKFNPAPFPSIRLTGNPALDTEKIDTFEAGVEFFFSSTTSAKADFFVSRVEDFIQPLEFGGPFPFLEAVAFNRQNTIRSQGGELEFRYRPSRHFGAILGYAIQSNDLDSDVASDSAGAYSPEHKLTALIEIRPVNPLLLHFSVNYWSEFDSRPFESGTIRFGEEIGQAYTYANFKTSVRIPVSDQHLRLDFIVKNLFDEEVQLTPSFGVDSSLFGREYFAAVAYDF